MNPYYADSTVTLWHGANINNTSGHRGVVRYEGPRGTRWHARIMANGKSRHLGTFATAAEAVAARRAAEREYFGEECPR